jgi:hypothetical protein
MMTRTAWACALLTATLAFAPVPARSADRSIVGTWRLVSMTTRDAATGRSVDVWGERPIGFLTYTAAGRMSAVVAKADRKISADSAGQATPEEQAALFRDSFGYAGRYTMTGDGVVHHVEVASDPTWIGRDQRRVTMLDGRRLTVTSAPVASAAAAEPQAFTLVWERIE